MGHTAPPPTVSNVSAWSAGISYRRKPAMEAVVAYYLEDDVAIGRPGPRPGITIRAVPGWGPGGRSHSTTITSCPRSGRSASSNTIRLSGTK